MPEDELKRAVELARSSDLFMVVGSTLLVHPAAALPGHAKEKEAFLVIVNLSETPYDNVCDVLIQGKAGVTLPEILKEVKRLRGSAS